MADTLNMATTDNMEDIALTDVDYLKGLAGVIAELNLFSNKTGEFKCTILFYLLKLELLNHDDLETYNNVEFLWNNKSADYSVNAEGKESVIFKTRNTFPSEFCGFQQGDHVPTINLPPGLENDIEIDEDVATDDVGVGDLNSEKDKQSDVVLERSSLPVLENVEIKQEPCVTEEFKIINIPNSEVAHQAGHEVPVETVELPLERSKIDETELDSSVKSETVPVLMNVAANFSGSVVNFDSKQAEWAQAAPRQILVKSKNMVPNYPCEICGKSFLMQHKLKRHIKTHEQNKLYVCDICDKSYNDKDNLRAHKKNQHEKKKWACATCGKRFISEEKMLAHEKRHTKSGKYPCQTCGKSFSTVKKLNDHKIVHKSKSKQTCEFCGWKFSGVSFYYYY